MCLLTPNSHASYAVPVRQYRSLPFRFLLCIPHGKPPCDVLTVRDVTLACKGPAPSGKKITHNRRFSVKTCIFEIFTDLRWWVRCSCRAHTCAIVNCRCSAGFKVLALIKHCYILTGNRFEFGNWPYRQTMCNLKKKHNTE